MTVKQNVDLKINPERRTFNTFKDFGTTLPYLLLPISFVQKKFISKTRLSALPIKICAKYDNLRKAWLNQLNKSENFLNLNQLKNLKLYLIELKM